MWGLGELPVKNMIHLLESKGIRVFSLSIDTAQLDAFSMWHADTPFVFLNTMKSCEHSRFDAAHELGHLVLHRHAGSKGQEAEREANAFASAFLMPRASVLANAPHMATVDQLSRGRLTVGMSSAIADGPGGLARGLVVSALALWLGAGLAWRQRPL